MEYSKDIQDWLDTIPEDRQKQFQKKLEGHTYLLYGLSKNECIERTKERIIAYMQMDRDMGKEKRKHGSKGVKHKKKSESILSKISKIHDQYGMRAFDLPRLFREEYQLSDLKRVLGGYVALCPCHNESTPSFRINMKKNVIKCFGCGISGNLLNFIVSSMRIKHTKALGIMSKYLLSPQEREKQSEDEEKSGKELVKQRNSLSKFSSSKFSSSFSSLDPDDLPF